MIMPLIKNISSLLILLNISVFACPPVSASTIEVKETKAPTVYAESVKEAQTLVVSSKVVNATLERGSFSATTPEEIAAKKAAEAEAARQAQIAEEMKKLEDQRKNFRSMVAFASSNFADCAGAGRICWPLRSFNYSQDNNGFQTASRPNHNGFDMLTDAGNPITAVADGKVVVSSESYGGYGVGVVVESYINGKKHLFTYGHMTYGTRAVNVGDTVSAGQLLGLVGSTGRSTANHLHLEVSINGSLTDPHIWLVQNAN